ncbi:hypothetical protein PGC35_14110 [Psychrobacillus sp. PGGUH221]|uniref:hypothetical protein n=1 Tax=Psychrobacillus sp. PGGUH221 TaxID=3020058 RepID=UPI0035C7624A
MDRKELVKAIGEHFGVKPKYLGAPNFNYQIETAHETYIIDREGKITTSEGRNVEFEALLNGELETEIQEPVTGGITGIEVTVPMDGHTAISLRNLINTLYSKQNLLKKALEFDRDIVSEEIVKVINEIKAGSIKEFESTIAKLECEGIEINFQHSTITFRCFGTEGTTENVKAYTQLVGLLNQYVKTLKYASAKVKDTDNEKFTFRVWLNRLGMIGDEYKETRKLLLQNLTGNSAFRYGKPEKETTAGE